MKLLILGGTRFLGRHLAEQALAAGHTLTLLHRGRSGPGLFAEAEHLIADRDGDLSLLAGRRWDAVIDTSAYLPRQVQAAARVLAGRVSAYQLVSTISVYAAFADSGTAEDAPLQVLADPHAQAVTGETYGGLKALCEAAARQGFAGAQVLLARPGLIVGPHDPTGRFSWWVQRLQRGGTVLAPGDPATPVQFIDVRDLARWLLLQAERGSSGAFNLNGPDEPLTIGGFLRAGCEVLQPQARLQWVDEAFLAAHGVAPWSDLPVWLPQASAAMHRVDCRRAQALGLRSRPLAQTLRDTAAWLAGIGSAATGPAAGAGSPRPGVGLAPEREAALLAAWAAQVAAGPAGAAGLAAG